MVKFVVGNSEKVLVGLGITDANIEQLKRGRPILVDIADVVLRLLKSRLLIANAEITIVYGKDEAAIVADLRRLGLVTPETEVINDSRLEDTKIAAKTKASRPRKDKKP